MPNLITNISEALPELKMELVEPTDISFEHLLLNYEMDMAFRRDPVENPSLQSTCLYSEPFALVVPSSHHLNLYVTWRKNDDSPILKNILQQVSETARKYLAEGN